MNCKCCQSYLYKTKGTTGPGGGAILLCLDNCSKKVKPKEAK